MNVKSRNNGICNEHIKSREMVSESRAMAGIGIMAAVDEIVFHQYWHGIIFMTGRRKRLADGFLHAFELILLVAILLLFTIP